MAESWLVERNSQWSYFLCCMQENLAKHPFVPAKTQKHLESQHTDWLGRMW